jgi:hypothetical protein
MNLKLPERQLYLYHEIKFDRVGAEVTVQTLFLLERLGLNLGRDTDVMTKYFVVFLSSRKIPG